MTPTLVTQRRLGALASIVVLAVVLAACSPSDSVTSSGGGAGVATSDSSGVDSGSVAAPESGPTDPNPASGGDSVAPSAIVGVWSASDGSGTNVIDGSGQCSGMYWNNGKPLDIGGPMRCTLGAQQASDGSYVLVVQQPPNQASYPVTFHGNSFTLISGNVSITLTRR